VLRGEPALPDKPEYIDFGAATPLRRRGTRLSSGEAKVANNGRLSNWPPTYFEKWRLGNMKPWKLSLKSWKFRD
jgi:hypothetical protein